MNARRTMNQLAFILCLVSFASCTLRQYRKSFRVLPKSPSYVLRFPNSREVPFSDLLQAYNGFEPAKAWIDLPPLMELRIENAYYQKGASRQGLAGFLGTEVAVYELTTGGLRLISTRPMKDRPADDLPVQQLVAETKLHFRFYRLYYEIVFRNAGGSHGSVLLGANSREDLVRLSTQLAEPEVVCNATSTHCTVFPEACSVSVEMKIVINGKPETVPWGSLLASITEQHPHLSVKRVYGGRLVPIKMDARDRGVMDLPLLPGDEISWN